MKSKIRNSDAQRPKIKKNVRQKLQTNENSKVEVSRHAEVSQARISTRRIRICGQKLKKMSVRAEKLKFKIKKKSLNFLINPY